MKKLYFTYFFCLIVLVVEAQNKTNISFRDYGYIKNIDSMELVYSRKGISPKDRLYGLLHLERWRRIVKPKEFGKDFAEIYKLAAEQNSKHAIAMMTFFEGFYNELRNKDTLTYTRYIEAAKLFAELKDTSGLVMTYHNLMTLYADIDTKKAKVYLKDFLYFSQKSSYVPDNLMGLGLIIYRFELLSPLPTVDEMINTYTKVERIIDQHPEYKHMRISLLQRLEVGLKRAKRYDLYLKYARSALKYVGVSNDFMNYNNVADAFFLLKMYDSSIVYENKAIQAFKAEKATQYPYLQDYYAKLSKSYYYTKQYKKAYDVDMVKDSLTDLVAQNSQKVALLEMQERYESEKKDAQIKQLGVEKQMADNRNLLIFGCLILALLVVSLTSILALRLKKVNTKLQQLQKERDKLFTIISHDLRSPLNTYQQFSLIVKSLVKTKQYERLDSALQQMDLLGLNLASMLNGLLQWSLLEQKNTIMKPSYVNTKTYFENLLPIYYKMAQLKSIRLNVNVSEQNIYIDANSLSVILRNLIDNAIKHNDKGHEIRINTEQADKDFNISITNDNDLKDDEQKQKLKDFFEGKKEYTFGEEGLGVGLILVKQYATKLNAEISMEAEKNNKVTFRLHLPNVIV